MKFARLFLFIALTVSVGGKWMFMQGVAWVGMAVTYSLQNGSVASGLSKTFDGEHPCPLCKAVQKGKQADSDAAVPNGKSNGDKKAEIGFADVTRLTPPPPTPLAMLTCGQKALTRAYAPESPPPRTSAV